jgi:hypothetical protein
LRLSAYNAHEMSDQPNVKLSVESWRVSVATILWLILIVYLAVHQYPYPQASGPETPAEKFSSARAMKHLRHLAKIPHPTGTRENEEVGSYIQGQVTAIGLQPELQETAIVYQSEGDCLTAARVRNVLVRKKGLNNTKAVLLMAHYDSVITSPGAGDDGGAVACLLETLRALQLIPPLRNDVIFLFTDGEEIGLAGARAFVSQHPWVKDVGLVLNFEARGTSGPSIMFETINGDNWLVGEFIKTAPYSYGDSVLPTIYKVMPHDTDLTVFRPVGVPGMNFAFIEKWPNYHRPLDSPESINERSLQHHGEYALALTSRLGDVDLTNPPKDDAVYFNLIGSRLIHYPVSWVWAPTALVAVGLLAAMIVGFRKGRLSVLGLLLGFVTQLMAAILSGAATIACLQIAYRLSKSRKAFFESGFYYAGTVCLVMAVVTLLYLWLSRKTRMENLHQGALLCWFALTLASTVLVPQATYLFVWPLLIGVGLSLYLLLRSRERETGAVRVAVLWLACVPALFLVAPIILLLFIGLIDETVVVASFLIALCGGLLLPLYEAVSGPRAGWLSAGLALASGGLLLTALIGAKPSPTYPHENQVFYIANLDQGAALWATLQDDEEDAWTTQFFANRGSVIELSKFIPDVLYPGARIFQRAAPNVGLVLPKIEVLERGAAENPHRVKLLISSPSRSPEVTISVESATQIMNAELDGLRLNYDPKRRPALTDLKKDGIERPKSASKFCLRYYGLAKEGATLRLETRTGGPIKIHVFERRYRLPAIPGLQVRPRTAEYMEAGELGDGIITYRSFIF